MIPKWRSLLALLLIIVVGLGLWLRHTNRQPQPQLPTISIVVKDRYQLQVELATQPAQHERGLMFRSELPIDGGMLFVFSQAEQLQFWMKNTAIPLSIAFMDVDGRILNIEDMQLFDRTVHLSAGPARYALEVGQGWFARHGVQVGDRVIFCRTDALHPPCAACGAPGHTRPIPATRRCAAALGEVRSRTSYPIEETVHVLLR